MLSDKKRKDPKEDIIQWNPWANYKMKRWKKDSEIWKARSPFILYPEIPNELPHLNIFSLCIFVYLWSHHYWFKEKFPIKSWLVSFPKLKTHSSFYSAGERGKQNQRGRKKHLCLTIKIRPLGTDHWVAQQNSLSTKRAPTLLQAMAVWQQKLSFSFWILFTFEVLVSKLSLLTVVLSRH